MRNAVAWEGGEDGDGEGGLGRGEEVRGAERDGAAGEGAEAAARDEAVEGGIEGIVPSAGGAAGEDGEGEEEGCEAG